MMQVGDTVTFADTGAVGKVKDIDERAGFALIVEGGHGEGWWPIDAFEDKTPTDPAPVAPTKMSADAVAVPGPGRKDDSGKARVDLIPDGYLRAVGQVLLFGAKRYGANNWQNVDDGQRRYWAAARRHMLSVKGGSFVDIESGLPHLAHVGCCLAFLMSMITGHDPVRPGGDLDAPRLDLIPSAFEIGLGQAFARDETVPNAAMLIHSIWSGLLTWWENDRHTDEDFESLSDIARDVSLLFAASK